MAHRGSNVKLYRLLGLFVLSLSGAAQATVLYDAGLGGLPTDQGYFGYLATHGTTPTNLGAEAQLDTLASPAEMAGWFTVVPIINTKINPAYPNLDRTLGFSVTVDAAVPTEVHASADRAGFSLVLLSQDLWGIELGFWSDQVWAQNSGFTHGEGAPFDAATGGTLTVHIEQSQYRVLHAGSTLLSGALRLYDPVHPVYLTPNLLFLGDDTGSAAADLRLRRVELGLGPLQSVPEPGTVAFALVGLALLRRRRR